MSAVLALVPDLYYGPQPATATATAARQLQTHASAAAAPRGNVLPWVWAVAQPQPQPAAKPAARPLPRPVRPNLAFYRKYTHALLHRYLRMSLEAGRTPSLLGQQEMFRAKITHYRVESFEDVVIFLHDIDRCLEQLDPRQQELIRRIGLEEYSIKEAAAMLRLDSETVVRRYARSLDALTAVFLDKRILEPLKPCQERQTPLFPAND